jgi:hypothetical protein
LKLAAGAAMAWPLLGLRLKGQAAPLYPPVSRPLP